MSAEEALETLRASDFGVLAFMGEDGCPAGFPLNYVMKDDSSFYIHHAPAGLLPDSLAKDCRVSFTVVGSAKELPEQFSTAFRSVIVRGRAEPVEGAEKKAALLALCLKYAPAREADARSYVDGSADKCAVYRIKIEALCGKKRNK
jgi:nitroimidazol reductase NimA-like FMN-containing flavoprotein (pyridoxamine 5'-phosphate oxidase superfamily)